MKTLKHLIDEEVCLHSNDLIFEVKLDLTINAVTNLQIMFNHLAEELDKLKEKINNA